MGVYRERTGTVRAEFWGPNTANWSHGRSVNWVLFAANG